MLGPTPTARPPHHADGSRRCRTRTRVLAMAGIGFLVLPDIVTRKTFTEWLQLYVYSAVIFAGPWLLSIACLGALSVFALPDLQTDGVALFTITVVYSYAFADHHRLRAAASHPVRGRPPVRTTRLRDYPVLCGCARLPCAVPGHHRRWLPRVLRPHARVQDRGDGPLRSDLGDLDGDDLPDRRQGLQRARAGLRARLRRELRPWDHARTRVRRHGHALGLPRRPDPALLLADLANLRGVSKRLAVQPRLLAGLPESSRTSRGPG